MKRYWKMIVYCIAIFVVIGTFYIQSSVAATDTLELNIEKVSGDEKELQNVTLYGDYVVENIHHSLEITDGENVNPRKQSFFETLIHPSYFPVIQKLVESHKGFMRGKDFSPAYFFEDNERVAYVNLIPSSIYNDTPDFTFDIEVLDKKTNKTISFGGKVPKTSNYRWLNVEDVQLIEDELKVVTSGSRTEGGDDLSLYTFNLREKKLVNEDIILAAPHIENGWTEVRLINDYSSTKVERYHVMKMEAYEEPNASGDEALAIEDDHTPLVAIETLIYDMKTNKVIKWEIPEEITESLHSAVVSDSMIFLPVYTEEAIEISQYDIEKEEWGEKQIFHIDHAKDSETVPYIQLLNGKIYIIGSNNDVYPILVGDPQTGTVLYEGKLGFKNQKEGQKNYELYFHDVVIK